ncbi:unnamed protein product, partial [marine sediment metagenome]
IVPLSGSGLTRTLSSANFADNTQVVVTVKTTSGSFLAQVTILKVGGGIDLSELEGDVDNLGDDVDNIIESTILNTVISHETITKTVHSQAKIRKANDAITTESTARAFEVEQLEASIETESGRVDSAITKVNQVEVNVSGAASAISSISGQVNNQITGLGATFNKASSAKVTADNTAIALTTLENEVNDAGTGLAATNQLVQQAQIDADNNANAVTVLQSTVNNPTTGVTANAALALQAKQAADGNV